VSTSRRGGKHPGLTARRVRPLRRVVIVAGLALAAIAVAVAVIPLVSSRGSSGAGADCQSVVVPAYFYPGMGWTTADKSRPTPALMILDITGWGAGSVPDPKYQAAVKRAQKAGITVMGYSATDYGKRSAAAVEADVRNYRAWYGVGDIFLDQVASGSGELAYYRDLSGYAHNVNGGSMVMLNPGTYPDQQYMSLGDVVMVYENSYASLSGLRVPAWVRDYPKDRFAYAIYATPRPQLASALSLSRERHAGYVYVTDGTAPDPYSSLPSYWSAEDSMIAAGCAG
jgi:hypothetical protein